MLRVRDKIIETNELELLKNLRQDVFDKTGKMLLNKINLTGNNIQFTCPIHKDGMESKASCGVSIKDIRANDKIIPAGTVHCFTCGYTASLDKMISDMFFIEDGGNTGYRWLMEHYDIMQTRKLDIEITPRNKSHISDKPTYINPNILSEYRYYHPYMYKRGLTDELIELYDVGYDKITNSLTFPIRDVDGNCIFVARRSVDSKWFHLMKSKDKPLYGLYELERRMPSEQNKVLNPGLYICESFINAITCRKWGYKSIALMGTGSWEQIELINKLKERTIVLCLDGDEAGDKGIAKLCKYIKPDKLVYIKQMPRGKDVNDLTYEEFLELPTVMRSR